MEQMGVKPRAFGLPCQCSATELQLPPATTPAQCSLQIISFNIGKINARYKSYCTVISILLLLVITLGLYHPSLCTSIPPPQALTVSSA